MRLSAEKPLRCLRISIHRCNGSFSFKRPGDCLRQFLPELRRFNQFRLVRIGQVPGFDEHGGPALVVQHPDEPRAAHAAVFQAGSPQQGRVQANGKLQIFRVEGVVGIIIRPEIVEAAYQGRGHARRCEAIRFEAGLVLVRRGGIEMQADEQIRIVRLGEAARLSSETSTSFVRVRKTSQPLVASKGASCNARSRVNSFSNRPSSTLCVPVFDPPWPGSITMTRLVPKVKRRVAQKRFKISPQIEFVQENLVANELRLEAEIDFDAVPDRFAAADFQDHHAICRTNRIHGHRLAGQQMWRADLMSGGPAVE